MSPASSLRASNARTIGRASRAGSRFAEQASWARTSTFGSIAARRASAAATAGETRDESHRSRTVQSRTYGSAWSSAFKAVASIEPADQVQCPE